MRDESASASQSYPAGTRRRRISVLWRFLCSSVLLLSACGRTNNIQPGDSEYPQENSRPVRIVHLTGTLPPTVPLQIVADYLAQRGGFGGSEECSFNIALSETRPFWIKVPLRVVRAGDRYSAEVALDRYEAGRCQWILGGIAYWLTASPLDSGERNPEAYVNADPRQVKNPDTLTGDLRRDTWCTKSTENPGRPYECGPLALISPESAAKMSQEQRTEELQQRSLFISPNTQLIAINFQVLAPRSRTP